MRDYNQEYQDNDERNYAYNFDYLLQDYMLKDFKKYFRDGNALEMGCYKGEFTKKIAPLFQELTIIEAASELIEITQNQVNNNKINYVNSTFEAWTTKEKFNNIFLIHTLEHLNDPLSVLQKINKWLDDTGIFFVAVPNANALSRQIATQMGLVDYHAAVTPGEAKHGHTTTYSIDTLLHQLKLANLKVIDFGGIFLKPFSGNQFDQAIKHQIINNDYLEACYQLGKMYPFLGASIYAICQKGA